MFCVVLFNLSLDFGVGFGRWFCDFGFSSWFEFRGVCWAFKFRFLFCFWVWLLVLGFRCVICVGFGDFGLGLVFSCYKTGFSGFGFLTGNFDLGWCFWVC